VGIGRLKGPGPEENAERWLGIVRLDAGAKEEETRPARATVMAKMRMVVFMKRTVPFEECFTGLELSLSGGAIRAAS